MVIASSQRVLGNLVDLERGLVSREIFTSEELYQRQLERVFARAWLFVGHATQIPNPGDYFVSRMGEESVILTRDKQGEVHVLLNTCMHRGMKVCRYDEGNTPVFSCPYHGWSYSTDGSLVSTPGELIGVPHFANAYYGELKKEDWGLISVPKLKVYHGTVWACWDPEAPEWEDYMGDMRYFIDGYVDGADGSPDGMEVFAGVQKFIIPSSWMYGAENFIGDGYHTISHRSVDLTGISPQQSGRHTVRSHGEPLGTLSFPDLGHGLNVASRETPDVDYVPTWPNNPEVDEFYGEARRRRQERLRNGEVRFRGGPGHVFPNTSFHDDPRSIFVWQPAGPMKMELWRWFLVDKNAPEAARQAFRHFGLRYSGPGGMTESDDAENWNYATAASKGVIAQRRPFNYEMGMGHRRPIEGLSGAYTTEKVPLITEDNARTLFKRWAEFMDAESWNDIYPKRGKS